VHLNICCRQEQRKQKQKEEESEKQAILAAGGNPYEVNSLLSFVVIACKGVSQTRTRSIFRQTVEEESTTIEADSRRSQKDC
jgi:hypothetical protein